MRILLWIGALLFMVQTSARPAPTEFRVHTDRGALDISMISPEIVRVRMIPNGARTDFPRVQIVLPQPKPTSGFAIHNEGDAWTLTSPLLTLRGKRDSLHVDFYDAQAHPLSLSAADIDTVEGQLREARSIQEEEEFFGFGLQFHSLAQRGKTKTLKVNADPNSDLGNSHAVVPFFLSTSGYGIFLDSHAYTHFDMGKTDPHRLTFQTPDPVLDYYFCYGPSFHALLARYTQLTGRMAMPPKWGLGFWYRMKSEWKADKVEEVAGAFRTHGIPCDVIGLEPRWQTHAYSCSYLWDTGQFPDPKAFVA
ncbi:MAG TPA: TIM-barrel domain-containing protein, partial [Chthonomonadaceae bacterium]|nr:TIM-barrel domain-containing protein [Chthonomonadaceae bacterium]